MNNKKNSILMSILIAIFASILFAFYVTSYFLVNYPGSFVKVAIIVTVPLVIAIAILIIALSDNRRVNSQKSKLVNSNAIMDIFDSHEFPLVVCDDQSNILFFNNQFGKRIVSGRSMIRKNVDDLLNHRFFELISNGVLEDIFVGDGCYSINCFNYSENKENRYFLTFQTRDELLLLKEKLNNSKSTFLYIAIDNYEELVQNKGDQEMFFIAETENNIRKWITSISGQTIFYDKNKFFAVISSEELKACEENQFGFLDDIRQVHINSVLPITLSIGASNVGDDYLTISKNAAEAFDLALQRGGDQVVVRTTEGTRYYRGRTKSIYKKNSTLSSYYAKKIQYSILNSSNVVVMGHKFGDGDSLGASIGIANICYSLGVSVKVAFDTGDQSTKMLSEKIKEVPGFENLVISPKECRKYIRPNTLLFAVDASNYLNYASKELFDFSQNIIVIDHHRKTNDYPKSVMIEYIDPTCSSTCELVSEISRECLKNMQIGSTVANCILAGIMLDTRGFVRNTGTRTFEAARYLRDQGANPEIVQEFFNEDVDVLRVKSQFESNIQIYKSHIAISFLETSDTSITQVLAAKAADSILQVQNIQASFAILKVNNSAYISARSNGQVNVQLIMEKLHGGGRFDVAGAKVDNIDSIFEIVKQLKDAIDEYLSD